MRKARLLSAPFVVAWLTFVCLQGLIVVAAILAIPLILTSWASSSALIAALPESAAARPMSVFTGHLISAATGCAMTSLFGTSPWLIAPAVAIAVLAMALTGGVHPPAAANAAIVMLVKEPLELLAATVMLGAIGLTLAAIVLRRIKPKSPNGNPGRSP